MTASAPHGDTWRLYIDLDRQHQGSGAFDAGIGGVREPGYLRSMLDAHAWLGRRADGPFGVQDYEALHRIVTAHAPTDATWRPGRSWVHVPRVVLEPARMPCWRRLDVTLDAGAPARRGYVRVVMARHAGNVDRLVETVAETLEAGHACIAAAQTEAARIAAVATLHRELELLHPTPDANTRRHLVLLQHLLARAGCPPSLLTEPNHVYARSAATWARCVTEGIARWRAVTHARQRGRDVAAALTAFDVRMRPLGWELGGWHRPEAGASSWVGSGV